MNAFKHKNVLVTGGAQGIGKAIADAYAQEFAHVIIADLNREQGIQHATELKAKNLNAAYYYCDVSKPEEIEQMFAHISKQYGHLDVLINNAGLSVWKSPMELSVEEWDKILNTKLRAQFLCAREAAKLMKTKH